jgi:uncharacterized protein (TIGR02246 family)
VAACQAGAPPATPFDADEVAGVLGALPVAWNGRDASAWGEHFVERSTFTNILGMHFPDRAANVARHEQLFATIFRDSRLTAEVLDVRPVGADGAVAQVQFELSGYERLPPGIGETEPGLLRTRLISVLERVDGDWRIVAAQNTAILPAALETARE